MHISEITKVVPMSNSAICAAEVVCEGETMSTALIVLDGTPYFLDHKVADQLIFRSLPVSLWDKITGLAKVLEARQ
jgi:hypothetical protein